MAHSFKLPNKFNKKYTYYVTDPSEISNELLERQGEHHIKVVDDLYHHGMPDELVDYLNSIIQSFKQRYPNGTEEEFIAYARKVSEADGGIGLML